MSIQREENHAKRAYIDQVIENFSTVNELESKSHKEPSTIALKKSIQKPSTVPREKSAPISKLNINDKTIDNVPKMKSIRAHYSKNHITTALVKKTPLTIRIPFRKKTKEIGINTSISIGMKNNIQLEIIDNDESDDDNNGGRLKKSFL